MSALAVLNRPAGLSLSTFEVAVDTPAGPIGYVVETDCPRRAELLALEEAHRVGYDPTDALAISVVPPFVWWGDCAFLDDAAAEHDRDPWDWGL